MQTTFAFFLWDLLQLEGVSLEVKPFPSKSLTAIVTSTTIIIVEFTMTNVHKLIPSWLAKNMTVYSMHKKLFEGKEF